MRKRTSWTKEEEKYLRENWGRVSVENIAFNLGRTEHAILNKKERLGLGRFLESQEYITWNQLCGELGYKSGDTYKMESWVKKRGFPIHKKKVNKCYFYVVYLDEFWKWAKKNMHFIDFSSFEENVLGKEPDWVKEKRHHDFKKRYMYRSSPWTTLEDKRLKYFLSENKYSYMELSEMLNRTVGAIQKRINDLKICERPVKAYCRHLYSDEEKRVVKEMIQKGFGYEYMSEKLGRSSKAIRGFVYRTFGTEDLDKARKGIKNDK